MLSPQVVSDFLWLHPLWLARFLCPWISQARILEQLPSSGDLPDPGVEPASLASPALAGGFFTTNATWKALPEGQSPLPVQSMTRKT